MPGPACYGRGGDVPTVTDACVVLGYFDPDYFNGGRMTLDRAAAERVIETLAQRDRPHAASTPRSRSSPSPTS